MSNTSTLSKVNKSAEWKARKKERTLENREFRANLNREKSQSSNPEKRAAAQRNIDEISNRGKKHK